MKEEINQNKQVCVVIDTNVLVSALLSKSIASPTAMIVGCIYERTLIPLYNDKIIAEYSDVLARRKFNFDKNIITDLLTSIQTLGIKIDKLISTDETFPDPDDVVFYEVRMSVDGSYLVTGNLKHFPRKPFVVTPAEMVSILKDRKLI